ncbi:hypothetical protein MPH_06350 [Macrophomina phaseolina MS6]|uniref:Uncharacterized protein n=1 Tax=Macrophomina phaseolina (strain MS6) TaxID=1126212 RepID=K2SHW5_MACPH|nr:hypothetical protein MPH_06350 [Macrophomina phaseolina MS6]
MGKAINQPSLDGHASALETPLSANTTSATATGNSYLTHHALPIAEMKNQIATLAASLLRLAIYKYMLAPYPNYYELKVYNLGLPPVVPP